MRQLVDIVTPLHTRTARDYAARMADDKVHCSSVARAYGEAYWDGDRRYGYGGYRYDGRWATVAQRLVARYGLGPRARVLDVGCGKAHLLYELQGLLPAAELHGCDVSEYGLAHAPDGFRGHLFLHDASAPLPFPGAHFDLAVSVMALHNLGLPALHGALAELERVARHKLVVVESYRDVRELFNLQCWALTCETFLRPEGWQWVFAQAGYTGDFEFAFFE